MPRSEDQRPLTVMVKQAFLDAITGAAESAGYADRSQFVRDAIFESLARRGVTLPASVKAPPSRKGKGGPRKKSPPP